MHDFSRPSGTFTASTIFPAINRWAINSLSLRDEIRSLTRIQSLILLVAATIFVTNCSSRTVSPATVYTPSPAAININTASAAELEELPQIGKTLAARIVEFRESNGPFRKPEYLMLVQGISDRRFRQIRDQVKAE